MLPHGEFIEVHEPLSAEKAYLLTQHEQNPALEANLSNEYGVRNPKALRSKIRSRLSRSHSEQITKPTATDVKELEGGHH
jgi:ubiquinol-cytochrome c reductase cytochrome b subunit